MKEQGEGGEERSSERQVLILLVADVDGEVATSDNLGVAAGLPKSVQRVH